MTATPLPEIPLWPGDSPGTPSSPEVDVMTPTAEDDPGTYERVGRPALFVYRSAKPSGAAALMFPGGGYQHVAIGKGSGDIARRLNAAGISVFILKYRLPQQRWTAGPDTVLQDGQRAIRLIRARAADWEVDRNRIAALGFSAGGYGAATLATRFGETSYVAADRIDAEDARPDLAGLMFPVIALDRPFAHILSRDALLGAAASSERAAQYSPDRHVSRRTPPTFLAHAADDGAVKSENSLAMYEALVAAHVPTQLHLFQDGGHGLQKGTGRVWMSLFLSWARTHGFAREN
jgi:acetyl esterase/lipase